MDVNVPVGEDGFDAPSVVAFTSILQPILKSELKEFKGVVSAQTLRELRDKVAQLLELVPSSALAPALPAQ